MKNRSAWTGQNAAEIGSEYEVVGSAKDGSEGYQLILAEHPDLVIMDIEMPEMDGLTMLEKLRKEGFAGKASLY